MVDTLPGAEELFLQMPVDGPERLLHGTRITEADGTRRTVVTLEPLEGIEDGPWVTAYYEHDGEFVKQSARVLGTRLDDLFVVDLELVGEPTSAEQRQHYRVSCLGLDVRADLGAFVSCKVVDVSATGFGCYAPPDLRPGDVVEAALTWEGRSHRGHVAVQSVRRLSPVLTRYGVRAIDTGDDDDTLLDALPGVNLAIQRVQLRRHR